MVKHLFEQKGTIGAVVREADQVFSNITRKTSRHGWFNRVEWQLLNLVKTNGPVAKKEVIKFLSFFESREHCQKLIDRFQQEGIIISDVAGLKLSAKGEQVFEEVAQLQEKIKERSVQGISAEAYGITVDTLRKMIDNLQEFLPQEREEPSVHAVHFSEKAEDGKRQEEEIRQVVADMERAHNTKDPALLASLFADDAVFVNAAGTRLHGKEAIYQSAKKVMETFMAKSYARYELSRISFIKEDIAVAELYQHPTTLAGERIPGEAGGVPTYVLKKHPESEKWKIIVAQNTLEMKFT